MLRPRVIVLSASLLATTIATPLTAQRLEVAARFGYSPPTGTLFQVPGYAIRSGDGDGLSIGAVASYWPLAHFGIQGSADFRFARHHVTYYGGLFCVLAPCPPGNTALVDTSATQMTASLRLVARQALGPRLQLSASLGPAMVLFGHSEYQPSQLPQYSLTQNYAYGVAGGLSAAWAVASRLRLTVSTDDVVFRVRPAAQMSTSVPLVVAAPLRHEFTVSAGLSVRVL